eukprot:1157313-Pelagomonas_calceolata.AAC.7
MHDYQASTLIHSSKPEFAISFSSQALAINQRKHERSASTEQGAGVRSQLAPFKVGMACQGVSRLCTTMHLHRLTLHTLLSSLNKPS